MKPLRHDHAGNTLAPADSDRHILGLLSSALRLSSSTRSARSIGCSSNTWRTTLGDHSFNERVITRNAHGRLLQRLDAGRGGHGSKGLAPLLVLGPVFLLAFFVAIHDLLASRTLSETALDLYWELFALGALAEDGSIGIVRLSATCVLLEVYVLCGADGPTETKTLNSLGYDVGEITSPEVVRFASTMRPPTYGTSSS